MKYFAYGSNMNPERMLQRGVKFTSRQQAILNDYELVFNKVSSQNYKEGFANIRYNKGSIIEGILYEIEDSDIKKLDRFEGYPYHYTKEEVTVHVRKHDKKVKAITYTANPDKVKEGLKPKRDYIEHLLKARALLSKSYCHKLESWETLD